MKKHRWLAALAAMVMVLAFAGCQINSDNHEHSFSKDWTSDVRARRFQPHLSSAEIAKS